MTKGKLRLGPLPSEETTKITLTLPAALREDLEGYARAHAQMFGKTVELTSLIPHMLTTFMARDRAFQKSRVN